MVKQDYIGRPWVVWSGDGHADSHGVDWIWDGKSLKSSVATGWRGCDAWQGYIFLIQNHDRQILACASWRWLDIYHMFIINFIGLFKHGWETMNKHIESKVHDTTHGLLIEYNHVYILSSIKKTYKRPMYKYHRNHIHLSYTNFYTY